VHTGNVVMVEGGIMQEWRIDSRTLVSYPQLYLHLLCIFKAQVLLSRHCWCLEMLNTLWMNIHLRLLLHCWSALKPRNAHKTGIYNT